MLWIRFGILETFLQSAQSIRALKVSQSVALDSTHRRQFVRASLLRDLRSSLRQWTMRHMVSSGRSVRVAIVFVAVWRQSEGALE